MTSKTQSPSARLLTIGGLIGAAAGIGILIMSGVDFPTIPPGPIILLVGAVLVATLRHWWAPVIGVAVAAFLFLGLLLSGQAVDGLSDPGTIGVFTGTAVMFVALIVALAAGIVATVRTHRTRGS